MKLWQKLTLLATVIALSCGGFVFLFQTQILTSLARVLVVDDSLQPADVIYILNGEVNTRPFHAAGLYQQGLASEVVIPREESGPASKIGLYPNGTDVSANILQSLGIPPERVKIIEVEGGVTSTRDEAQVLRDYVETNNIESVIVVTSAFHTRRSRWIFNKLLTGSGVRLQVSAAPQWKFDETNWWQKETGLLMFANEYLKFGYYLLKY